jgi:hypothetical protein
MLDLVQPLAAGRQLLGLAGKTRRDAPGRKGSIAKGYSRGSQLFFGCTTQGLDYPRSAQRFPLGFLPAFEAPAHCRGFLLYCGVAEPNRRAVHPTQDSTHRC